VKILKSKTSLVLEAQITRADGTVEPKKVVAAYYSNPLQQLLSSLRFKLRGVKGKVKLA
jgi:hypothetical protein